MSRLEAMYYAKFCFAGVTDSSPVTLNKEFITF